MLYLIKLVPQYSKCITKVNGLHHINNSISLTWDMGHDSSFTWSKEIITVDPWLNVTVLYVICKPCLENMNAPQKERNLFFKKVARLLQ